MTYPVHEITSDDQGYRHGTDGTITTTLLETEGRMFKRRSVHGVGGDSMEEDCWLVTELDGVRVYQQGMHVVVTRQDLRP